ncbi:sialidase family protein [Pedobacter arcticus]|uniref:sialidase family protein n=1 Tax=Pedobacter arcticus TaxID=752140 RepID=UPI0002E931A0|nr:sialidase family protein [Pedobacter arcticus]
MSKKIKHLLFTLLLCTAVLSATITFAQVDAEKVETNLWKSQVAWTDPGSNTYLGSPSLVKLTDGNLLASHDYFGKYVNSDDTFIHLSKDDGKSWTRLAELKGMFWGNLFLHNGAVYLLGTSAGVGVRNIVIMKSMDGGKTWSTPTTSKNGILFSEGVNGGTAKYHCAPMPIVNHNGRIYRAFENLTEFLPGMRGYKAFAISANENADLLNAANWTKSTEVAYDTSKDPEGSRNTTGWIEGNMVVGPDGRLWDILRVNSTPFFDRAAMVEIKDNGKVADFDPQNFITLPGGISKFVIRKDPTQAIYWMLSNTNTDTNFPSQRSVLSLYASKDLRNWYHAKTLMEDDQGLSPIESIKKTGFQYPDWIFNGNDLIYLSRTAYAGARNYHDSNRITFGNIADFRNYLPENLKIK